MLSETQQLAVGKNTVDRANGWLTLPARGACDPQTSGAGPSATGTCLALQKVSLQTSLQHDFVEFMTWILRFHLDQMTNGTNLDILQTGATRKQGDQNQISLSSLSLVTK